MKKKFKGKSELSARRNRPDGLYFLSRAQVHEIAESALADLNEITRTDQRTTTQLWLYNKRFRQLLKIVISLGHDLGELHHFHRRLLRRY